MMFKLHPPVAATISGGTPAGSSSVTPLIRKVETRLEHDPEQR